MSRDPMELVGRLDRIAEGAFPYTASVAAEAAACIREMVDELEDARISICAFCAPWAVTYARDRGFPDGFIHAAHYDTLAKAGARMDTFTRYLPPAPGAEA